MISEIKAIIRNYLNNASLCMVMVGTVVNDGVKVSDKLVVPMELVSGMLKRYVTVGDKVKLIRNHGGQEYYIVEIMGKEFVTKGCTVKLLRDGILTEYKVEDVMP